MKIAELRAAIIPVLSQVCAAPIIQADQIGPRPDQKHATFKFTTSYGKAVGQADEVVEETADTVIVKRIQDYKTTISFTAYAMDDDESVELAQTIYDWFDDDGLEVLQQLGVAVVDQTDITNRDAFVVENYERRNGFDVILRVSRVKEREFDWFDSAQTSNQ